MPHVAVLLSGCGYLDGAEITESVATLIALDQAGISYDCFAPNRSHMHVVDHLSIQPQADARNILAESARIARGRIADLTGLDAGRYDALLMPGGFGAAKNLCNFAEQGQQATLYADVEAAVLAFIQAKKPLVAICAAPLVLALAARTAGIAGARLTVGAGGEPLSEAINAWGQQHIVTPLTEACVDPLNRFITAPAYMYGDAGPAQIFASVSAAIAALRGMLV
ncbi:isoprenoid biosynthesis glyoxalase ElbB [Chitinimonas sp.]|uniref:isoprenoid biosynthesis glyoxalase ElbB n=1 Tax=Chitinimonas sp. TaxID=1934313 RepID=UPI0035B21777